jgi:pimeloyl-ACP methyl ester carboxylesterase
MAAGGRRAVERQAAAARGEIFARARDGAIGPPLQLVWATDDPLATPEGGLVLFDVLRAHQRDVRFDVVNRAGSFVFREQPQTFHALVAAFHDTIGARQATP